MTVAEMINKLSKYSLTAKVFDYDDKDYIISDIVYDPESDELYAKFDFAK